jgi:hypothetical protein
MNFENKKEFLHFIKKHHDKKIKYIGIGHSLGFIKLISLNFIKFGEFNHF